MRLLLLLPFVASCAITVRRVSPSSIAPHGQSPGMTSRLVATQPDGTKEYVVVLSSGDEVLSGLLEFAQREHVTNARFSAIGAVHDPEVGWYDLPRKTYKAMRLAEQVEIVSLLGDVALSVKGAPIVHTHVVVGRSDGRTFAGHLLSATTSPTLEVYLTSWPTAVHKQLDEACGLQLIRP